MNEVKTIVLGKERNRYTGKDGVVRDYPKVIYAQTSARVKPGYESVGFAMPVVADCSGEFYDQLVIEKPFLARVSTQNVPGFQGATSVTVYAIEAVKA